jgi:hypothetical protein
MYVRRGIRNKTILLFDYSPDAATLIVAVLLAASAFSRRSGGWINTFYVLRRRHR